MEAVDVLAYRRFFVGGKNNDHLKNATYRRWIRLKVIVFSFVLCSVFTSAATAESIEITTGEYAPWTSESLKHGGFSTHVITEAFKLEGYDVNFTFYPWKRVYEAAKDGRRFHASSWWYTSDERAKDFHYSDPLLTDSTVFFYLKENPLGEWNALDDLKGRRIGATAGYTYTPEFWEAAKSGLLDIPGGQFG